MWALSETIRSKPKKEEVYLKAKKMWIKALPGTRQFRHLRSRAFMIKALGIAIPFFPEKRAELIDYVKENATSLVGDLKSNSIKKWHWFDDYLGYNNAIIPEALLIAGQITQSTDFTKKGLSSLDFLIGKTFMINQYLPIGHSHWYKNKEKRSDFDQQPEDPASMILALSTAFKITRNQTYKKLMLTCFSWFLGNNGLQQPLYNYENGGCYDGLHPDRINLNQGAESQVSYLLARLAVARVKL
jgi:hypothetical protein